MLPFNKNRQNRYIHYNNYQWQAIQAYIHTFLLLHMVHLPRPLLIHDGMPAAAAAVAAQILR